MINLNTEKDYWNKRIWEVNGITLQELVSLGQHWVQIKTLERNDIVVYNWQPFDPEFESKMRGVAEFLFDLRKKIWQ